MPYVAVLRKFLKYGRTAFESLVSALCFGAAHKVIMQCDALGIFDSSFETAYANLKVVQEYVRLRGIILNDGEVFGEQYVSLLLGRVDNVIFHDYDDARGRTDPHKLERANYMSRYVGDYKVRLEQELQKEARRFATIIAKRVMSLRSEGLNDQQIVERVRPENAYLANVAAGGTGGYYVPAGMQIECDDSDKSKKVLFAYMCGTEARFVFDNPANYHTYTKVFFKTEEKARLLAAGSQAAFYHQSILSALAETEFLDSLPETPMLWSAPKKQDFFASHHTTHSNSYNVCRDFKNFNECIRHRDLEKHWFGTIADEMKRQQVPADLIHSANACEVMMTAVGVIIDGQRIPWVHGLQSGWRMTMLLNTVMNICMGRAARAVVSEKTGISFFACLHQGDDSKESCSSPWGGPLVQSLLDAAGMPGAPLKQLFPSRRGGGFEFLREWITPGTRAGSAIRAACRFTCPDLQSPVPVGGVDMGAAVATSIEKVRRRLKSDKLRVRDMETIVAHWTRSPEDAAAGRPAEWRAVFLPRNRGGLGITSTLIDPDRFNGTVTLVTERRLGMGDTTLLESIVKHKLPTLQKNLPLARYSKAYTEDVVEASRGTRQYVEAANITGCSSVEYSRRVRDREQRAKEIHLHATSVMNMERQIMHAARREFSMEESAKEYLIAAQFGGSERAARAWVRDGCPMFGHFPGGRKGELCQLGLKTLRDTKPDSGLPIIPTCLPQEWMGPDTRKLSGNGPTAVGDRWYAYCAVARRMRSRGWLI
jgi:hypothetical protein